MAKKQSNKKQASERQAASFLGEVQAETAASHLEALAVALRDNHVVVQAGTESIALPVGSRVDLSLEAKPPSNKGKSSLKLNLSWDTPALESLAGPEAMLSISSGNGFAESEIESTDAASASAESENTESSNSQPQTAAPVAVSESAQENQ